MVERIINNIDVAKELFVVLSYFEDSFIKKIPNDILLKISDMAAESEKEVYIEENKEFIQQGLSNECMEAIGILYFLYVMNEEQRDEIIKQWMENEKEFRIFDVVD